jgi:high affinity sulfate transporter 1
MFVAPKRAATRWHLVPLVAQLRGYASLRGDVLAGVVIAALAVPQAMAYAQTAGLPVVAGLYGLVLPLVVYAALGSSRVLMTGPTTTAALMVAPVLVTVSDDPSDYPALAAMLALLVAAVFGLARLAGLGWMADYFSSAVLLGFLTGLGLTLIAGQIGVLAGVEVTGYSPLQQYGSFFANVTGGVHWTTLSIGVVSLLILLAGSRWAPRFPTLLALTIAMIALSWAQDLAAEGVAVIGEIPAGLPRLEWPGVAWDDLMLLLPGAVAIAVVGFSDAILTARSLASVTGSTVDADQELLALGGLNLAAGLTQSFPVGSSGSRSAVNASLGGRTQVVSLVQAATVVVVLLLLTPALALLPRSMLAAVIIYAALRLIDVTAWRALAAGSRGELLIAAVTVAGMLTVGLLPSLMLAVLLSLVDAARRSAQPRDAVLGWSPRHGRFVDLDKDHEGLLVPGVVVYRIDDRLFFANAHYFAARVEEAITAAPDRVRWFILDAEAVSHLDASATQVLREVIAGLSARGIRFVVARARDAVVEQIDRFDLTDVLGPDNRFPTVRAAVLAVAGVDVTGDTQ